MTQSAKCSEKFIRAGCILLLICAWSVIARATTYYVDAASGNDANNGRSTTAAWQTFAKVNSVAFNPGDAILLARGRQWREQLLILRSGTESAPITYGAYGTGDNPIINGADVVPAWTPAGGNLYTASVATQPEIVVFNGTKGMRAASLPEVDAVLEWHWASGTLTVYSTASPVNIEASARQFILFVHSQQYVTVRDLTVQYGVDSVCLFNTQHVVVDNLAIRDNAGYGSVYLTASIAGAGRDNTIQNCVIERTTASLASAADENYGSGIFVWGATICGYNIFTRNILRNNGHEGIGILQSSNNLISYNEAYQNAQVGLRIALEESTENIIEHNLCYQNCHGHDDRFGIDLIRVGNNNIVRYNIVHDQQTVAGGPYGSGGIRFDGGDWEGHDHMGSTGNTVCYNIVYNEYVGIMSFNHSYIEIYNNVIYNISHYALVIHSVSSVIPSGNIAKNNIVYVSQGLVFYHNNETNSTIDHNVYRPSPSVWYYWNGTLCNFETWKTLSGQDAHSASVDPGLVNPAALDFHLQSGSPCIDAGTPLSFTADFEGNEVPQGNAVDVGALESSAVSEPPVAAFNAAPVSGPAPLTVVFTDASTAGTSPITSRSWNFGDGSASAETNPSHTYAAPGSYTVALTVITAVGSDDETKTSYITANPVPPTANFSATPVSGATPLTVVFTEVSTAGTSPITSRSWDFGDGATSTESNPSHTYAAPGSYTVALTVITADGSDEETKTSYITANPVAPTANFSAIPLSGAAPLTVVFTDGSTAGTSLITSRLWDFGDGATSTETNPSHVYAAPGSYTITLTVTTAVGSDIETKTSYVTANPVGPTADFSAIPLSGAAPLTVSFSDASTVGTSSITSRLWSFGDGFTSTETNPSHIYAAPGSYAVTLTVTTDAGSDGETKIGHITVNPVGPAAAFGAAPLFGSAPLTVNFTDTSTSGTSPITSRLWAFGDGATSAETHPSHAYATPGVYSVTLTVATAVGNDQEIKTSLITANPVPPTADFSAVPISGPSPLSVTFMDNSAPGTSSITGYAWDFGDGGTSTEANPTHAFTAPGTYTVTLTVTTAAGSDAETKTSFITANPVAPKANFSAAPMSGFSPLSVTFTDTSLPGTSPITGYAWDFGDGGTSAEANPTHAYANSGAYTVTLAVTTAVGMDEVVKPNYITADLVPPTAAFTGAPLSGDTPLTVDFANTATPGTSPITGYTWDFGDDGTSAEANPAHTYTVPGVYTVSLLVISDSGSDEEIIAGYVTANPVAPVAAFTATPMLGSTPLTVIFADASTPGTSAITTYSWDFGDGGTSTEANPVHTYSAPGTYDVALTVTSAAGSGTETKPSFVIAQPVAPVAGFSAVPTAGVAPLTVNFADTSSPGTSPIISYAWDFGDSGTSTEASPVHTYAIPGTYTVTLAVASAAGNAEEVKTDYITANPVGPTAYFDAAPIFGTAPLLVRFTDASAAGTSPITAYAWDFGDGGTSAQADPDHTYAVPGAYTVVLTVTTAAGTDDEIRTSYISVNPVGPEAGFTATPRTGDAPLTVAFMDASTPGTSSITGYAWDFSDGGTSLEANPIHVFNTPGSYTITHAVTTAAGMDDEIKTDYITVNPVGPVADFSAAPTAGNTPLAVSFTDLSVPGTSSITVYAWDFGDGATSAQRNPSHVYADTGAYTVTLTVSTAVGSGSEIKTNYITADPISPTANFSATPSSGPAPLTVDFTNASLSGSFPITGYAWDFGDGESSTLPNPSHTYAASGAYSVSLTIVTAAGNNTVVRTNYITVDLVPPTALFSGSPTFGPAPLTVSFADASTSGTSPITAYTWYFGDGGTSTDPNPSHTYAAPGSYTVSLAVVSDSGSDDERKTGYIAVNPVAPLAEFTGTPLLGYAPLSVVFSDASTPGTSPILGSWWEFGDGGVSADINPVHVYAGPGTYDVSLTVTTAAGANVKTKTGYITANPVMPIADFSGAPSSGAAPLLVVFTDLSSAGSSPISGRLWDFGDGGTSTAVNPNHTYISPGSYTVTLTITTAVGNDQMTRTDYIAADPVMPAADFAATPAAGFAPLTVYFTDLSIAGTSPIASHSWNFGDGQTSAEANPNHTYATPGVYDVVLSVTTADGADEEAKIGFLTVNPVAPKANFSGTPTSGPAPLEVRFVDGSEPGTSPITAWAWDFGDGETSADRNPSHTYATSGAYTVRLTVTTAVGSNQVTKTNYVTADLAPPAAAFTGTPTAGVTPLTVAFVESSTAGSTPITQYAWDFGDGGTSAQRNPSHTYATPGSYAVSLAVISESGSDEEVKTGYITAQPVGPAAGFTGAPTAGSAPLTVRFADASTPGTSPIAARSWDFGDGGTSTGLNPSHTYVVPGSYTVTLNVSTAAGSDGETKVGYITAAPVMPTANFTAVPAAGTVPLAVQFNDASTPGTSPIIRYAWDFGDGGTSSQPNPSHVYESPGSFTVSLTIATAAGSDALTRPGCITVEGDAEGEMGGPVWFVDVGNVSGAQNGRSWATAFTTLQPALDAAAANRDEVWVAEGIYAEQRVSETGYPSVDTGSLALREGVRVYGGFAGTETVRDQRDWRVRKTIVDGAQSRGAARLPAYHTVIGANEAMLDGFTVRGGLANGAQFPHTTGAGLFNWMTSPAVANCLFEDNVAAASGGAAANYQGAAPTFQDCTFSGNHASASGGAMANADGAIPQVADCAFLNNTAAAGAAMANWNASPDLARCAFQSNTANTRGGAISNDNSAQPVLRECTFTTNQADSGGAMANSGNSSPSLTRCTFFRNSGVTAGAIFNQDGSAPILARCTFQANAADNGGALYNLASRPSMTNCILLSNLAVEQGGAMVNEQAASPTLLNCTFTRNSARSGGALANRDTSSPSLTNCILWANLPTEFNAGGNPVLAYCDVRGGFAGTGNINSDPLFLDVEAGNLGLQENSPCIDTGQNENAPDIDILGMPRPQGPGMDIGAHEAPEGGAEGTVEGTVEGGTEGSEEGAIEGSAEGNPEGEGGLEGEPAVNPPVILLQPGAQLVAAGDSVSFTVGATGSAPLQYQWTKDSIPLETGTDATLTLQNVQQSAEGQYRCAVSNPGGTTLSQSAALTISIPPAADFGATPLSGGAPLTVQFTDLSRPGTLPIIRWFWDFGDAATSTEQNPQHRYQNPGVYTVKLIAASDFDGNGTTKTDYIEVTSAIEGEGTPEGEGTAEEGEGSGEGVPDGEGEGSGEDEPRIWFVDAANIQGGHDGKSWNTAFQALQEAVDAAHAAGGGEVWVAGGIYAESRLSPIGTSAQNTGSLVLARAVALYGGFAGDETQRDQRDWLKNVTVIDGAAARNGQPAYHVIIGADDAILDGFTIRAGRADGNTYPFNVGGGLLNYGVSPSLRNCSLTQNYARLAGAAIANDAGAKPTLENCAFVQNTAVQGGGAVSYAAGSGGVVTRCAFSGNSAAAGGAIYGTNSDFTMFACTLSGNASTQSGGALQLEENAVVLAVECLFQNNHAANTGGAAAIASGAGATFDTCQFLANSAPAAGAVHNAGTSQPAFVRCFFTANTADYGAAAMNDGSSAAEFTNCVFYANQAQNMGGAILNAVAAVPTFFNCSFGGNSATNAGGIANVDDASSVIVNCILWDDLPEEFSASGTVDVTYSIVEGGHSGRGNLKTNPRYRSLAEGDLSLKSNSPAIGAGTAQDAPAIDFNGQERPWGGAVDIGAYEFTGGEGEEEGEINPNPCGCEFSKDGYGALPNPADLLVGLFAMMAALVSIRCFPRKP